MSASHTISPLAQVAHDAALPRLVELHESELQRHVDQCRAGRSRWFSAAAWMERLHDALAPRFLTTVAAAAGLLWITAIWP